MKRLVVAAAVLAGSAAVLVLATRGSSAQEEGPAQRTQLVAAIDISPLQQELAAVRAELAAIRQGITDATGLRNDVAQAAAAIKAMAEQTAGLAETFKKYANATEPVIRGLKPETQWEYKILRSRSESVANRWGREGWFLVTAAEDWLFFRRPLQAAAPE